MRANKQNMKIILIGGYKEESEILAGIKDGDMNAFRVLFDNYRDQIFRLSIRMLGDEHIAQDIVQETFTKVFRKISEFKGGSALSTWIYRIAVNLCLNEAKKRERDKSRLYSEFDLLQLQDEKTGAHPETNFIHRENYNMVMEIISKMKPKKRLTFLLFYIEELTTADIAFIMHESHEAVLKRLQRIREEITESAGKMDMDIVKRKSRGVK